MAALICRHADLHMFPFRQLATALAAAAVILPALATDSAETQFAVLASLPEAGLRAMPGQRIEVEVDLAASPGFAVDVLGERAEARYRMAFNLVARLPQPSRERRMAALSRATGARSGQIDHGARPGCQRGVLGVA